MSKRTDPDKFIVTKYVLYPGLLLALLVRCCVAAYPYSGRGAPPMFGDFEAQRHWQEVTVHTPARDWYRNTTHNDLQYWGLDYPPLSAYHSLLLGLVADWLEPESVRLFASRGYESETHETFMRWTVFLSDLYFYVTAVLCICIHMERVTSKSELSVFKRTDVSTVICLLYPGIILIDHGHFQYNCVSLGLFLRATFFIVAIENDIMATIFFVLALNYKQMELYHALPFFFYLLRKCFITVTNESSMAHLIYRFTKLAIAVIGTFSAVWYPLVHSWDDVLQILHRLFPIKRGVFEDKVSNVWCSANVFVKLKHVYNNEEMVRMCVMSTLVACMPSCLDLFFRINRKKFVLCLINVSLAFFLFSYQVHEKSILLVAIPVTIYLPDDPFTSLWFLLLSTFSMLPLLLKDGLLLPLLCTSSIYLSFYSIALHLSGLETNIFSVLSANTVYEAAKTKSYNHVVMKLFSTMFFFSLQGMILLGLGSLLVKPPPQYPDLFPLLISMYSCLHFIFFLIYFTYCQLQLPMCLPVQLKVKKN
ncbi:dolichyl pyrophosphate Man9GlcNAc2 alpha-1,3-glucosyltransferase-like [Pararge aegeria]|uniref:dolichyl pyrophosphate Man9GlcNAc2 alpha-1,3-glucosyltransferase-like n=1 Tax=Pararge aegeria TaxID=116150 RepID=UPI0019D2A558|nr:dolichyl pyrophosphate Man9GlcNAc2 alpha-1,3-glucosyltransferase-like [Pararge aegeria]